MQNERHPLHYLPLHNTILHIIRKIKSIINRIRGRISDAVPGIRDIIGKFIHFWDALSQIYSPISRIPSEIVSLKSLPINIQKNYPGSI